MAEVLCCVGGWQDGRRAQNRTGAQTVVLSRIQPMTSANDLSQPVDELIGSDTYHLHTIQVAGHKFKFLGAEGMEPAELIAMLLEGYRRHA